MGMTQSVFCVCYMANVDGSYSTVFQLSGWERLFVNGKIYSYVMKYATKLSLRIVAAVTLRCALKPT